MLKKKEQFVIGSGFIAKKFKKYLKFIKKNNVIIYAAGISNSLERNKRNLDKEINKLTHKIIGCAMEVHNQLGNGFQEVIYQRALSIELGLKGIMHEREKEIPLQYKNFASLKAATNIHKNREYPIIPPCTNILRCWLCGLRH